MSPPATVNPAGWRPGLEEAERQIAGLTAVPGVRAWHERAHDQAAGASSAVLPIAQGISRPSARLNAAYVRLQTA